MDQDALIGDLINRLLARRPDLWAVFQTDPLGALQEARIVLTAEERAALEAAGQTPAFQPRQKETGDDALARSLREDLARARAATALDYNPLADVEAPQNQTEEVDESLLDEQRRLRQQAEAMRAQLAEERERQARERELALRRLGGGKGKQA